MTKEEVLQTIKAVAKEMLDETPSHFDAEVGDEVYSDMGRVNVILEMNKKLCAAVESLPYVPGTNDGDMISRKAAIEALKEAFNPSITNFVKAKIAIDKLPSAQPEIIRCKDCKYWQDQEEEVVEVPICARPENKYEKFPFVMLLEDGEDRYKCEHHEDGSLKWTYLECDKCGRKTLAYCYEYQATELWNEGKTEEEQ